MPRDTAVTLTLLLAFSSVNPSAKGTKPSFAARVEECSVRSASLGSLTPNPGVLLDPEKTPPSWIERHRTLLGGIFVALTLALGGWAFRLLRSSAK